jgi:poly(3-hydroxybutyrate) depolymerase
MSTFANLGAQLFGERPLSLLPGAERLAAGYELFHRLGKEYEKPTFGLEHTTVDGALAAVRERVVRSDPFCRLVRFEREIPADRAADPKILIVAPLSGHHATLLRDTVRAMLPAHDVYVTDWVDARMVPLRDGAFRLDDYVRYVQRYLRALGPDVHVVAVCQPTVPVLAAVSLMATAGDSMLPRTMTLMGGPIDARKSPTKVNELAFEKPYEWFERTVICTVPDRYAGRGRRVYPGFLQLGGFVAMNPEKHARSHWDFYLDLVRGDDEDAAAHRRFYDEYNAVLDMPAEYYLDTIKTVFQDCALANGTWEVDGVRVSPSDIRTVALLTIEGELDDISGPGQTEAAQALCSSLPSSMRQHFVAPGCGHYGIFSGRRWREDIQPNVAAFIREHALRSSRRDYMQGSTPSGSGATGIPS